MNHAAMLVMALATAGPAVARSIPPAGPPTVEWRVKDRFRLFDQASVEARRDVNDLLDEIETKPDAKLVDHYAAMLKTLTGEDGSRTNAASLRASNYIPAGSEPGRTAGRYAGRYLYPTTYKIEARLVGSVPKGMRCHLGSPVYVSDHACSDWTAVANVSGKDVARAGSARFAVIMTDADGTNYPISGEVRDELIVALGDSFISGEGNPDVPSLITTEAQPDFKRPSWGGNVEMGRHVLRAAEWWDEPCHRSLLSWPVLSSLAHAAKHPHRAVTLVHLGCSGAIAKDIYLSGETDLPGGGNERLSQLEVLDTMLAPPDETWPKRKVDTVVMSVGGNDIGFASVIATLMLPPNGYFLGATAARLVGKSARAVCPYADSGKPLSRLCDTRESAQDRLYVLPTELDRLAGAVKARAPEARVLRTLYPNPLLGEDGKPCDTRPDAALPTSGRRRSDSGFEALMGILPKIGRGPFYSSWNFELAYSAEGEWQDYPIDKANLAVECDLKPEPGDSEICQGLWVHRMLNEAVVTSALKQDWTPVGSHLPVISGNGLCRFDEGRFSLSRVVSEKVRGSRRWRWRGGKSPQTFRPYDKDNPRWFRVTNDSIVTQFGFFDGKPRFEHGTVHPTYRAHIEYAQAVLDAMRAEQ